MVVLRRRGTRAQQPTENTREKRNKQDSSLFRLVHHFVVQENSVGKNVSHGAFALFLRFCKSLCLTLDLNKHRCCSSVNNR